MPQANTVKDQIAKFHKLCDLCELDKDNTPQINYREVLFNHYFQYAEDQVLVTLVDFAKSQVPQLKLFEEILHNVDEDAYGYYKAHAHPLIILKANDFSQFQVFPNVILDAAGIPAAHGPVNPAGSMEMFGPDPAIPGAAGQRADQMEQNKLLPPGTVQTIQIPKGSNVPDSLKKFNPGPSQNPQLPKPENKNPTPEKKRDSSS